MDPTRIDADVVGCRAFFEAPGAVQGALSPTRSLVSRPKVGSEAFAVGAHGVDDGVGQALPEVRGFEAALAAETRDERGLEQSRGHTRTRQHVEPGALHAAVGDFAIAGR